MSSEVRRSADTSKRTSTSRDVAVRRPDPRGPVAFEDATSLTGLQAVVDVARGEVTLGHCDNAVGKLEWVLEQLVRLDSDTLRPVAAEQHRIVSASAYSLLARCREALGQQEAAREAYHRAARLFDQLVRTVKLSARDWANYGETLDALGRTDEAIDALTRARDLGFRTGDGLRRLGSLHLQRGQLALAEAVLREAVELTAENDEAPSLLAETFARDDRRGEAAKMFVIAGMRAATGERLEAGLEAFRRASEHAPDEWIAWLGMGEMLRLLREPEAALDALDRAVALKPESGWATGTRAQVLHAMGDTAAAIDAFQFALELDPELEWVHADLAEALASAGDVDRALAVLENAPENVRDSPNALSVRAELLWRDDQLDEALEVATAAVKRSEGESWPLALCGEILRELGRQRQALSALDQALKRANGHFPWALATKGQALRALDRTQEARSALEEALDQDHELLWAREELAGLLLEMGDPEGALDHVEQILAVASDAASTLALKARILLALEAPVDARDVATKAVETKPDHVLANLALSEALAADGDPEAAVEQANAAVAAAPHSQAAHAAKVRRLLTAGRVDEALSEILGSETTLADLGAVELLADELRARGRYAHARDVLERSLDHAPPRVSALRLLGHVQIDLGLFDEAATTFDMAASLAPSNAELLADRALAQDQAGLIRSALRSIREALSVNGDDAWALTIHGLVLADSGEFEAALAPLARATDIDPDDWLSAQVTGWALEHLGPGRAPEAHEAYRRTLELNKDNLYTMRGFADTRPLDQQRPDEYQRILDRAFELDPDPALMSLMAWCQFRQRRYDEAINLHLKAVSSADPETPQAAISQFDFALTVLASGRLDLGVQEYERGCRLGRRLQPERSCGVLSVAISDLQRAKAWDPSMDIVQAIEILKEALAATREKVERLTA